LILRAARFAAKAHLGQFRKHGHADRPYIDHPMRVAGRVSMLSRATPEMVAAAWLHDVLEDTFVRTEMVEDEFGTPVAALVLELTNPGKAFKELPRAERKAIDRRHLVGASWKARAIKLIDRIDNLRECLDDPQTPPDFLKLYRQESMLLLEVLRGTDEALELELEKLLCLVDQRCLP